MVRRILAGYRTVKLTARSRAKIDTMTSTHRGTLGKYAAAAYAAIKTASAPGHTEVMSRFVAMNSGVVQSFWVLAPARIAAKRDARSRCAVARLSARLESPPPALIVKQSRSLDTQCVDDFPPTAARMASGTGASKYG